MTSPNSTVTTAEQNARPSAQRRGWSFDNRFLAPVLITGILLVGQLTFGILESYTRTLLAIVSSILMELVLARLITGKWPHLASAYITGISVGILIRSPALWPYVLCSLISITSKYAIRWHGRHLWNPSNLGVSAMLYLAPASVAGLSVQWGNAIWPMLVIWLLGSMIIMRLRRFHICATYVASFLFFSVARSAVTGDPWLAAVSPITGPMYQLFVFFMITDPKTTVRTKWGQCVVAFLVALVEAILRLNRVVHAPYYALFFVGPAANAIEIWWTSRRTVPAAQQPLAVSSVTNSAPRVQSTADQPAALVTSGQADGNL
ncbi:MAG TPA: RnfABCDGE type electron transport complex subunit D [Isosphaeraceae bacterium]|nr:RnfABCDGE type electron transport complex subunit D [Isosphaeraceae bacterium]